MAKTNTPVKKPPAASAGLEHLEVLHLKGCPAGEDRIESYVATTPDGEDVQITRCVECGASAASSGSDD